jgi:hypothetical protein
LELKAVILSKFYSSGSTSKCSFSIKYSKNEPVTATATLFEAKSWKTEDSSFSSNVEIDDAAVIDE